MSKKCRGTEAVPADSEVEKVTADWFQSGGRSTVNKLAVTGVCERSIVSIPTAKMEIPVKELWIIDDDLSMCDFLRSFLVERDMTR